MKKMLIILSLITIPVIARVNKDVVKDYTDLKKMDVKLDNISKKLDLIFELLTAEYFTIQPGATLKKEE